jgi:hypothetical protein
MNKIWVESNTLTLQYAYFENAIICIAMALLLIYCKNGSIRIAVKLMNDTETPHRGNIIFIVFR